MNASFILSGRQALLDRLSVAGWARCAEAVTPVWSGTVLNSAPGRSWRHRSGPGYDVDEASLDAADLPEGLGAPDAVLLRHSAGQFGLPPLAGDGVGFLLDLNPDWPSGHGGLVMIDDGDRLHGWRPEPGALTIFPVSRPPLLTMVSPAAATSRTAVYGRLSGA